MRLAAGRQAPGHRGGFHAGDPGRRHRLHAVHLGHDAAVATDVPVAAIADRFLPWHLRRRVDGGDPDRAYRPVDPRDPDRGRDDRNGRRRAHGHSGGTGLRPVRRAGQRGRGGGPAGAVDDLHAWDGHRAARRDRGADRRLCATGSGDAPDAGAGQGPVSGHSAGAVRLGGGVGRDRLPSGPHRLWPRALRHRHARARRLSVGHPHAAG